MSYRGSSGDPIFGSVCHKCGSTRGPFTVSFIPDAPPPPAQSVSLSDPLSGEVLLEAVDTSVISAVCNLGDEPVRLRHVIEFVMIHMTNSCFDTLSGYFAIFANGQPHYLDDILPGSEQDGVCRLRVVRIDTQEEWALQERPEPRGHYACVCRPRCEQDVEAAPRRFGDRSR